MSHLRALIDSRQDSTDWLNQIENQPNDIINAILKTLFSSRNEVA